MEVCCLVVDFDTAAKVVETDLRGTEFVSTEKTQRAGNKSLDRCEVQ
jgi:hypothetical protein